MQYHWLNNSKNKKLIIFFAGWSFDYKPFEVLECDNYDVMMFYDYKELHLPIEIPVYESYYLITWSMGVYIAYILREQLPEFSKKIAINGTPFPIHNEWGIPQKTFDLTLKYVDTGLQGKFQRNLFKNDESFEKYMNNKVLREIPEQAEELSVLKNSISNSKLSYDKFYDCAIISDSDKIVPTKNQINCWKGKSDMCMIESGHFPFYDFASWKDILDKCN